MHWLTRWQDFWNPECSMTDTTCCETIREIVRANLCMGCGACVAACPRKVIAMEERDGANYPLLDGGHCDQSKACGLCARICPGIDGRTAQAARALFPDACRDEEFGRILRFYSGYSNDPEVRYHSASGGMLSQFATFLLEKGEVDGVVVTRFAESNPLRPQPFIARSADEILQGRSSKYCPVSMDQALTEIMKTRGRYLFVGLPCHVQAVRKLATMHAPFRERIRACFGIYCSGNRSYCATDYLLEAYGIDRIDLRYFAYRDDGCLGFLKAEDRKGAIHKIPYRDYYRAIRSFFKLRRCNLCMDYSAELADVSFGDLQTEPYSRDTIGTNSVIVRTREMEDLLRHARRESVLTLDELDRHSLYASQRPMLLFKKRKIASRLLLLRALCRRVPAYDNEIPPASLSGLASALSLSMQMMLGRRRMFWPVIRLLSKQSAAQTLCRRTTAYSRQKT